MDLWEHNPHLTQLRKGNKRDVEFFKISYGEGIRAQKHETVHFLSYFHRAFSKKYDVDIVPQLPYPDLHLTDHERDVSPVRGRYWIVLVGGKSDFTAKVWETQKFQQVTDELNSRGLSVVQVGSSDRGHWHPGLRGVLNLVGRTNLRDMLRLVHHSEGVICGITMAMHMAAALQRPCVVLSGGREAWWWEAYVNENEGFGPVASGNLEMPHKFLHTIGQLDCCQYHGCWKNKVVGLGKDTSTCYYPITRDKQVVPKCMDMIQIEHVMDSVMSYYEDKKLPPVDAERTCCPKGPKGVKGVAGIPDNLRMDLFSDLNPTPTKESKLELIGDLEGRPQGYKVAADHPRGAPGRKPKPVKDVPTEFDPIPLQDPIIGGKFTMFALLYGDYPDMHRACLDSILDTVPAQYVDLRIGSNELCQKTLDHISKLVDSGLVTKHYSHEENIRKYPVMREMFYDPDLPVDTKYLIWFDDDTICNKDALWLSKLTQVITDNHDEGYRMYGPVYTWKMRGKQEEWVKQATWYADRQFRNKRGLPASNGKTIHFVTGSFWALETAAMRKCDIPDIRIGHNGGDYMIGEQLYQGGYKLKSFSQRKNVVGWSAFPRRGLVERHTGCP
jgi:hypothetical protein